MCPGNGGAPTLSAEGYGVLRATATAGVGRQRSLKGF